MGVDDGIGDIRQKWEESARERTKGLSPSEQMKLHMKQRATDAKVLGRSCESLLGICAGEMADGVLNDDEIRFLDVWLNEHGDIAYTWPGEVIYARIREALRDGQISEEERRFLKESLAQLVGGDFRDTGAAFAQPTTLPIDRDAVVQVPAHSFCFTGNFLFGTRAACLRAVTSRNGMVGDNVTLGLDFLVIGTMTSEAWAHTTWGRKIEKAVEYRQRGYKLRIIGECQWVAVLG